MWAQFYRKLKYSVISYSWDTGLSFHLAVKDAQGGYSDRDLSKHIFAALDWMPQPTNQVELYAINVTRDMAVYGLQIDQGDAKEAVVWIDLHNWCVRRTEVGYLARKLISISN